MKKETTIIRLGGIFDKEGKTHQIGSIYDTQGLAPNIDTCGGGYRQPLIMKMERIRKLTEGECYRLMGFEEKDTNACKEVGQPKSTIYHQAGDSIVTTCLVALFGELLGFDYSKAITDHTDKLHAEVKG